MPTDCVPLNYRRIRHLHRGDGPWAKKQTNKINTQVGGPALLCGTAPIRARFRAGRDPRHASHMESHSTPLWGWNASPHVRQKTVGAIDIKSEFIFEFGAPSSGLMDWSLAPPRGPPTPPSDPDDCTTCKREGDASCTLRSLSSTSCACSAGPGPSNEGLRLINKCACKAAKLLKWLLRQSWHFPSAFFAHEGGEPNATGNAH